MKIVKKTCKECGKTKPVDEFAPHPLTKDGLEGKCRGCRAKRRKVLRKRRLAAKKRAETKAANEKTAAKKEAAIADIPKRPSGLKIVGAKMNGVEVWLKPANYLRCMAEDDPLMKNATAKLFCDLADYIEELEKKVTGMVQ